MRCDTPVTTDLVIRIADLVYHLVAVFMHHGFSSDTGHYTCLVEDGGWLCCDDSEVSLVSDIVESLKDNEQRSVLWLFSRQESAEFSTRSLSKTQAGYSQYGPHKDGKVLM